MLIETISGALNKTTKAIVFSAITPIILGENRTTKINVTLPTELQGTGIDIYYEFREYGGRIILTDKLTATEGVAEYLLINSAFGRSGQVGFALIANETADGITKTFKSVLNTQLSVQAGINDNPVLEETPNLIAECQQAITDADSAALEALAAATFANEKGQSAELSTGNANAAAINANAKAILAQTATDNANTATENANVATGLTNAAIGGANTAAGNAQEKADYADSVGDQLVTDKAAGLFKGDPSTLDKLGTAANVIDLTDIENGLFGTVASPLIISAMAAISFVNFTPVAGYQKSFIIYIKRTADVAVTWSNITAWALGEIPLLTVGKTQKILVETSDGINYYGTGGDYFNV